MVRLTSDELSVEEIKDLLASIVMGRDIALKNGDFTNSVNLSHIHKLIYVAYVEDDGESDVEEESTEDLNDGDDLICPICNGLGEDPRTDKICTSCHGQGWRKEGHVEDE